MTFGWPYPKRKAHLDQLASSPSDKTQLVQFQGQDMYPKIYTIPIELPKYRLNNGRTYAAQAEYLATHPEAPGDLFTKDLELDEAQRIQHALLSDMLDKADMYAYFEENKQAEALILSHDGFVINGNRRLCAMRELLTQDPEKYRYFEHINIVILPPADERDIDQLEATLQIKPDIRAEYSWYARALMFKKRRDEHHHKIEDLARLYQMDKSEIEELIDLLNYAEAYLGDRGKSGQYHELEKNEFAFKELRKARGKFFKTEVEKNCFEKISYCLIDDSTKGGRLYENIPSAAKHFDKVVERMREEFELQPKPIKVETIGTLALFGGDEVMIGDILEAASDSDKYNTIREIVTDVVTSEKLKDRERERANFVFTQIKKANTALIDAANALTDQQEKNGISQQLQSIDTCVSRIKVWMNGKSQD